MAQILINGVVNPVVPDAYVNVITPNNGLIVGAPTNVLGVVGVGSWGPVNAVGLVGSNPQAALTYGNPVVRSHDIPTACAIAILQGALNMKCVRVTDGTDTAAHRSIKSTSESYQTATVGGSNTPGNVVTITATYTDGTNFSFSYTTITGDTLNSITTALLAAANASQAAAANGFAFSKNNAVLSVYSPTGWTLSYAQGSNTVTVTFATVSISYETATLGGTVSAGDELAITFTPSSGTPWTIQITVQNQGGPSNPQPGLPTLAQNAAALAAAGNTNPTALAQGFTFDSNGVVVDIYGTATAGTFSRSVTGTETITLGTATGSLPQISVTSKYTGSLGNTSSIAIAAGSAVGSMKVILSMPGYAPEVYDNISGIGNLLWVNAANAINNGQSGVRGPSQLMIATAGNSAATFLAGNPKLLTGGTDGALGVGTSQLIGSDTIPRTGIYVLRGQGCSVLNVVELSDPTVWSLLAAFGMQEGVFTGDATVVGDTIANAVTTLSNSGVDTPWFKAMLGDWCYFYDAYNAVQRLVSPFSYWSGLRVATPPQNSTLNEEVSGLVGTQKSASGIVYTTADLQALISGRLDVICNPAPGGPYFAPRSGRNSSSNAAIRGENYTMVTDFLTASIGPFVGTIVGKLQNPSQRRSAKSSFDAFFAVLAGPQPGGEDPVIGNADGTQPWQVVLNSTNNPPQLVAQGFEVIGVKVQYQAVIEFLVVNLEGGQTVSIQRTTTQ